MQANLTIYTCKNMKVTSVYARPHFSLLDSRIYAMNTSIYAYNSIHIHIHLIRNTHP